MDAKQANQEKRYGNDGDGIYTPTRWIDIADPEPVYNRKQTSKRENERGKQVGTPGMVTDAGTFLLTEGSRGGGRVLVFISSWAVTTICSLLRFTCYVRRLPSWEQELTPSLHPLGSSSKP